MIRFYPYAGLLVLALALPPVCAQAAVIEAPSHVTDVTIYTDRALVTRSAKIHVPAGAQTISITDMPAGLNEATLRVQGKALAAVKIGTVELKHEFLTELVNTTEREKTAQIEAKTDEKAFLQGDIKAVQAKQDFISHLIDANAETHEANTVAKLDFAPEKWVQAWNLLQNGMAETQKDITNKTIALRKLDNEIAKLQLELGQVHTQQAKERRDAHVNIEASAETDLDLTLTYQTSGAGWRPAYDARLDTGSGQMELEQYGQVSQSTGEDWSNIALTLSTAQPATGSEMPRMAEWMVRLFAPYQRAQQQMSMSRAMEAGSDSSSQGLAMDKINVAASAAPAPVQAEQVMATAQTTEYSAQFQVPGQVDLKSSRDMTKLYIGAVKMKAELMVQTSPRLNPQAYLFAKATNHESYPLIPGVVAKYRDGTFIGNASLPLVRPDEKADFSFGTDDRVKVAYKRLKDEHDNPALVIVGGITVERQYQTKVQNLHKEPVTIMVLDQYPVTNDADVSVTFLDDQTTPGFVKDSESRQGVVSWTGSYNPKEEKTFTLGFRVKYPKGKVIEGL